MALDEQVSQQRARAALAAGSPVVLIARGIGGLLMAAAVVSPEAMAFAVRHGSGLIRVALGADRANDLGLPPMWQTDDEKDPRPAADFAVCVDAAEGISTGISARDRTVTARLLADPVTRPLQLRRPGHLIPVRVSDSSRGYAWACAEALRAFALEPVAVFTEVIEKARGEVAGPAYLHQFALDYRLPLVVRPDHVAAPSAAVLRSLLLLSDEPVSIL